MHLCNRHHPHASRRTFLSLASGTALACGCMTLAGCAANPATGEQGLLGLSSVTDDVRLGSSQYPELIKAFGGAYNQDRVQNYVTAIGRRVAATTELPDLPYEFTVLNSPIINALALPGGKIAITRGLLALASSEAEVAGVLAHEAGHVNARHGAQGQNRALLANVGLAILGIATGSSELMQLGQTVAQGFLQGYSRDQEFEADTLGVRYLARAGYDPAAMPAFLASMREQSQVEAQMHGLPPGEVDKFNIMASHPRTVERVQQANAAAQASVVPNPVVGRAAYLEAINGLMFADDPEQGLVRGRRFIHPVLRITFTAPAGFLLRNSTENVTAQHRDGAAIVFDAAPVQRARNLREYLQYEWAGDTPLSQVEDITVNGLAAATGVVRLNGQSGPVDVRLVAYAVERDQVYRFTFITPANFSRALSTGLRETTYSFRRIDETEAAAVKPLRVVIAPVNAGDTVASLARSLPYEGFNEAWFRLLNDLQPGQELTLGQSVKIVVS
ncbi:MAG: M48 family metalloprotease [Rhodospirillaceae bacterium]|nr:M48 family metalloprotease [Rhodospirillaceae bacterium]